MNSWLGMAFEKVCLLHVEQIKAALKIAGISIQQYSWRSKDAENRAQIDLIIDRADGMINLCEIKYSETDYSLITANPVKRNQYTESLPVKLTSDCLFA